MWPDESLALHPDKSCMFNFMPDENKVTWFTVHAALAPKNSTLPAGFPGHYFIMNMAPQFQRTPFIAQFDGDAGDVIMLAYKVSELRVYAYGIPVDKVIAFKPPSGSKRGQEVDEAAILSSYKLPHPGIVKIKDLTNTETHKLADMVENMLQYIPLFKQAKIANLKDFPAVEAATVHANISRACLAAELRLRKVAKDRGDTSKDPKESAAGGADAGKSVAEIKSQLLANMMKYYEPDIEDRFFKVQTASAGSMRLTEEGLKDTHEAINKSDTTLDDQLHTSLDKLGELSKEVDAADKLNFVVQSPIESLLVAAVSRRAMQKIPSLELDGGGGAGLRTDCLVRARIAGRHAGAGRGALQRGAGEGAGAA